MKFFLVIVALFAFSASAFAQDSSDGCGLGWQITSKTTMSATTTRGTTNAFVPPTFGMTSGTLGCAKHDIAKNDEAAAMYAVNNYDALSIEMAEGRGEILAGFARVMGCSDAAVKDFGSMTQKNYRSLIQTGAQPALEMFEGVKGQIQQNPALAAQCNA